MSRTPSRAGRPTPAARVRVALGNGHDLDEDEQTKALDEQELAKLFAEIPAEWRLFFKLLAQSGPRIGEAIALEDPRRRGARLRGVGHRAFP